MLLDVVVDYVAKEAMLEEAMFKEATCVDHDDRGERRLCVSRPDGRKARGRVRKVLDTRGGSRQSSRTTFVVTTKTSTSFVGVHAPTSKFNICLLLY